MRLSPKAADAVVCASLLVLVNFIFGGYAVITSAALKHSTLSPTVYALLRDVGGSCLLLAMAYAYEARQAVPRFWPSRDDQGSFILVGLLMVWGAQGCSAQAVANLTPSFFSLLQPIMPVVTTSLSLATGYESFHPGHAASWGKMIGIAVTLGGGASMVAFSSANANSNVRQQSKNFGLGLFFAFLQLTMGGSFSVAQKPLLARYNSIVVAAWGYVYGTGLLALSAAMAATEASDWALTPLAVAGIAYSAVLSSAVAYALLAYVNQRASPVLIASFMPLQAVAGALLGWIVLGETLEASSYAGGTAVVGGLLLIVWCRYLEAVEGVWGGGGGGGGAGDKRAAWESDGEGGGDEEEEVAWGAGGGGGGGGRTASTSSLSDEKPLLRKAVVSE